MIIELDTTTAELHKVLNTAVFDYMFKPDEEQDDARRLAVYKAAKELVKAYEERGLKLPCPAENETDADKFKEN